MLKIFVNTWGNYNENGADGGEWITLPMDEGELEEKLESIAANMGDHDPEWAIHDYEWEGEINMGEVHEMDSITDWNERCQKADDLDDDDLKEIAAAIEAFGYGFAQAMELQQNGDFSFYPGQDLEDVAYDLVEECYFTKDTPDIFKQYFDYKAFARDLGFDGYTETQYGVIVGD
jgi:antirestriction protein